MAAPHPALFVTGGTGFLGSHFVAAALAAGYEVRALRRPGSMPRHPIPQEPEWIDGQLDSVAPVAFRGCAALIHLAAVGVSPQRATWEELYRGNVLGPQQLWECAADAGIKQFLFCGSAVEYGASADRYERIPTTAPLEPLTPYAASKAAASLHAIEFGRRRRISGIIFRCGVIFGSGQHAENFWPALRAAAQAGRDFPMTAGEQKMNFLPVESAAQGILQLIKQMPAPGTVAVRHICDGPPQTLFAFAEEWWARFGANGRLLPGAMPYRTAQSMRVVLDA